MAERSSLVRLQDELELSLEWVGYELHPETPAGGRLLSSYLPNAEAMLRYVHGFAEGFGITDLVAPQVLAPTRRVLAVSTLARAEGRLDRFREVAFDAYWRRGWGIESDDDLRWIAREAGLDGDAAVRAAADPAAHETIAAARRAALGAGVRGVPTFDFLRAPGAEPEARVVGCQRYEVLVEAARKAGARRRHGHGPGHHAAPVKGL